MKKKVLLLIVLLVLCLPISVFAISEKEAVKKLAKMYNISEDEANSKGIKYCYYNAAGDKDDDEYFAIVAITSDGKIADSDWWGGGEPIMNWNSADNEIDDGMWDDDLDGNPDVEIYPQYKANSGTCPPIFYHHNFGADNYSYLAYSYSQISQIQETLHNVRDWNDDNISILVGIDPDNINGETSEAACSEFYTPKDGYNDKLHKLYDTLKASNKPEDKVAYEEYKNEVIAWCKKITKNSTYGNPCLKVCHHLTETINDIEDKQDTYEDTCGFSEKLRAWIIKIIRWVKYIVPVIVIFLGVIDFIRATGADKEDEMKKAQKRFVIRLIAAALIFVAPIIIEFLLTKFGFISVGCGIIKL